MFARVIILALCIVTLVLALPELEQQIQNVARKLTPAQLAAEATGTVVVG
ncbi:hypothetical protein EUX98_g1575 [Antrodiella citrinella]|uniref:Uncharacterized protein n=1 Tax=Antrodiella citrinella TaxID=2447956 RepID=A0A4V3XJD8_9APHY|nr:hypothetical protein EUX98_g1575 [Antrodiella citrinella]